MNLFLVVAAIYVIGALVSGRVFRTDEGVDLFLVLLWPLSLSILTYMSLDRYERRVQKELADHLGKRRDQ